MRKIFGVLIAAMLFLTLFATLGSAYYYNDDYSRRTYASTYERNGYFRATNYDRVSEKYWNGNSWVTRTSYIRETRESPSYGFYSGRPQGSNNFYGRPWYTKYWNTPRYEYSYPRNYYVYGY